MLNIMCYMDVKNIINFCLLAILQSNEELREEAETMISYVLDRWKESLGKFYISQREWEDYQALKNNAGADAVSSSAYQDYLSSLDDELSERLGTIRDIADTLPGDDLIREVNEALSDIQDIAKKLLTTSNKSFRR